MSDSNSGTDESNDFMNSDSRQPTKRMLPAEYTSADHIIQPGEGDQSPKFLITPCGTGANRVMLVGTVTEIDDVGDDQPYFRMRCTDPTGSSFLTYAGQYQPDARNKIAELEFPEYVQVIGKPSTLETDDGGVLTSVRPEAVNTISESEFYALCAENAQHTIERLTGERGHDYFEAQAATLYYSESDMAIYEQAVEMLETVAEEVSEDDGGDTLSRDTLKDMEYNDLQKLAGKFENINGNATADALVDALADKPSPA